MASLSELLNSLSTNYRKESMLPTVGNSLISTPIVTTQYDSPWVAFGANLAKNLLGSGLSTYSEMQSRQYDKDAKSALLGFVNGTPVASSSLDPDEIEQIRAAADIFKADKAQQLADLAAQLKFEGDKTYEVEKAKARAQNEGTQALLNSLGEGGSEEKGSGKAEDGDVRVVKKPNPALAADPRTKPLYDSQVADQTRANNLLTDARDYLNKGAISAQKYQQLKGAMDTLVGNLDLGNKANDLATIYAFAKTQDELGSVREGDFANVEAALPVLSRWLGDAKGALTGEGTLSRDAKLKLIQAALPKYESVGGDYNDTVQRELARVKAFGVDPSMVDYLPYKAIDFAALSQAPAAAAPSGGLGNYDLTTAEGVAQQYAKLAPIYGSAEAQRMIKAAIEQKPSKPEGLGKMFSGIPGLSTSTGK